MENLTAPKSTPRDFFMCLLVTGTLYASVVSFLALLFAYVDVLHPDKLGSCYDCALGQIRWSSAALIVVFPVFLVLFWRLAREYVVTPEKRELKVRRWLAWFTLFLAAVTIIVDLVRLVYNFYNGDLTANFLLKVIAVLIVAVAVFWFYLKDLRADGIGRGGRVLIGWLAALAVIVTIVGGFLLVGSPATQRARRFDQQRIGDLQNIQWQVINYWQNKGGLPYKLADMKDSISGWIAPVDPQTGQPYEYKLIGQSARAFQLCANFQTAGGASNGYNPVAPSSVDHLAKPDNWQHAIGQVCFDRSIDPGLYRPNPKLL